MKAMTKQQLANQAGTTVKTLMRWCKPYRKELERLGMTPNAKLLTPAIVEFITQKLCIDTE